MLENYVNTKGNDLIYIESVYRWQRIRQKEEYEKIQRLKLLLATEHKVDVHCISFGRSIILHLFMFRYCLLWEYGWILTNLHGI